MAEKPGTENASDNAHRSSSPEAKKVRIALFTVMELAVNTIADILGERDDVELSCVVTCTGPRSRRSDAHIEVVQALWDAGLQNVDVVSSNRRSRYAEIAAMYGTDLVLSMGYPWLLPVSLIADSRIQLGAINVHNSHLPKYRGPNAFGWAIINGDDKLGFCVHRMDAEFDTGPILVKESVPFGVNEDFNDSIVPCKQMVSKAITMAIEGEPGKPQVGEPSHAPKFHPDFRWIDFSSPSLSIHNKVRAFYGRRDIPRGALAKIDGETLCLTRTRVDVDGFGQERKAASAPPGTIVSRDGNSFVVQCGDTVLTVLDWHKVEETGAK